MQTAQHISADQLDELVKSIFDQGTVVVRQAYSDFDCPTTQFVDADVLRGVLQFMPGQKPQFFNYAIYYPDAKGYTFEKRIALNPKSCDGHTFRFAQEGWGLIHFQCDFRKYPTVECRIAVNSRVRAETWYDTYPEHKNPDLWNWDVVEKKAGRLIRLLRKLGKQAEQSDARETSAQSVLKSTSTPRSP